MVPLSVLRRTQHWGARGLQLSSCGMMGELEQGREGGMPSTLIFSLIWETDGHIIETRYLSSACDSRVYNSPSAVETRVCRLSLAGALAHLNVSRTEKIFVS